MVLSELQQQQIIFDKPNENTSVGPHLNKIYLIYRLA